MLMNSKILTLLGFASKAGKLSFGMDMTAEAVVKRKCQLVITADDVSGKSLKEITFFANKTNTTVLTITGCDMQTLSHSVGHRCAILSVNDKGFAEAILKEIGK